MIRNALFVPVLALALLSSAGVAYADNADAPNESSAWQTVKLDYSNFYLSGPRWTRLGIAFGVAGVMANTHIDQGIRDWYQDHERTAGTDHVAANFKKLGEGKYLIPLSLAAAGIGVAAPGSSVGAWGQRTFRAYLVGGPAMLMGQTLTGGSRPEERSKASHWRPFQDTNGVSGHAFIGAVPFLTIARMSHNSIVRYGAYFASTFAAWSRINDDAHFTSQAFLGWYMAYEATDAVNDTNEQQHRSDAHMSLIPLPHGALAEVAYRW